MSYNECLRITHPQIVAEKSIAPKIPFSFASLAIKNENSPRPFIANENLKKLFKVKGFAKKPSGIIFPIIATNVNIKPLPIASPENIPSPLPTVNE